MNIDEIRAEIPKAFLTTYRMKRWLFENGIDDAYSMLPADMMPVITRMLVDWAYAAGKAEGIEEGFKKWQIIH